MADEVKKLFYSTAVIANKPGEGAKVLAAFAAAGINFIGVNGYPRGKTMTSKQTTLDLVPEDPKAFAKAAKKLGVAIGGKFPCISLSGGERLGAVSEILGKLGAAGINVIAMHAVCAGEGRFGSMLFVATADVAKALRILKK